MVTLESSLIRKANTSRIVTIATKASLIPSFFFALWKSDVAGASPNYRDPLLHVSTFRGGGQNMPGQTNDPWIPLGGGAINEKKRLYKEDGEGEEYAKLEEQNSSSFRPSTTRSHLWHALEGMDRYPNYLSRWSSDDMDRLEDSLMEQVTRVRQQKEQVLERRQGIQNLVNDFVETDGRWKRLLQVPNKWEEFRSRILDPGVCKAIFDTKGNLGKANHTVPEVLRGEVTVELNVSQLATLMDEELFDVFSFRLLSLDFCRELREFIAALHTFGQTQTEYAELLVGRRPVDLDTVGLSWLNDLLFHLVMRPISKHLFQTSETIKELDWRQGYVAGYSAKPSEGRPRERLATHTDDSEVTLNVCLGDEHFEGGLLEFRGLRGTDEGGHLIGTFQPQPGLALIHAGRHFHHVTQVTSGDRFAYIIWARSWQGVRSQCCPCCWLNRRQDNSCVCSNRWN